MTVKISHTAAVQSFFKEAAGFGSDNGSPRLKSIILRVLQDDKVLDAQACYQQTGFRAAAQTVEVVHTTVTPA